MIREETKQELERFKNIHDNYSFTVWLYTLKKNDNNRDFASAANILSEYGNKLSATSFSEDYYKEHFKVLVNTVCQW